MSWLLDLRSYKDDASVFYKLLYQHAAHFGSIHRLWQHEIIRVKPEVFTYDLLNTKKPFLVQLMRDNHPHITWLRDNLTSEKVALMFTTTEDPLFGRLALPSEAHSFGGFFLQGFMFTDPADAVTFKLMWSEKLA